jgi:hypothetical protein
MPNRASPGDDPEENGERNQVERLPVDDGARMFVVELLNEDHDDRDDDRVDEPGGAQCDESGDDSGDDCPD